MENNGRGMISPNYSTQDYINLNLSINSGEETWESAIRMLEERFYERFFSTIHFLLCDSNRRYSKEKAEKNGFAIMALNCLLIDTFYQFEYGMKDSMQPNSAMDQSGNAHHYVGFLNSKFSGLFSSDTGGNKSLAELFYKHIRCGILHSAQTYGSSMLSCEGGRTISYMNKNTQNEGIRVEVRQISNEFEHYFKEDYINRLRSGNQTTRENFIAKMQYVCNLSPQ